MDRNWLVGGIEIPEGHFEVLAEFINSITPNQIPTMPTENVLQSRETGFCEHENIISMVGSPSHSIDSASWASTLQICLKIAGYFARVCYKFSINWGRNAKTLFFD